MGSVMPLKTEITGYLHPQIKVKAYPYKEKIK